MQQQRLILFFCCAAALATTFPSASGCVGTKKQTIHVVNRFAADSTSLLRAHCASKDDDFGVKSLGQHQEFNWNFCPRVIFQNTLYFCHFFWATKQKAFVVYDQKKHERNDTEHYWLAEDDGIYYYNNGDTPFIVKMFDWDLIG